MTAASRLNTGAEPWIARLQTYPQHGILAVGGGPMLLSLVSALIECGFTGFHLCIADRVPTDRQRLAALLSQARRDRGGKEEQTVFRKEEAGDWRDVVRAYQTILYVSQDGDPGELLQLGQICREERKALLPAVCLHQAGMAGPFAPPGSEGGWASAWRRLHRAAIDKDPERHAFSSAAGALLANVVVSGLLKLVAGADESEQGQSVYLLDLETLEGSWHSYFPHPFANGRQAMSAESVENLEQRLGNSPDQRTTDGLFSCFSRWTSAHTGIFHTWEEGDLRQLPLAQCRVRAVDPLSEGPAQLLPDIVCAGLTHEEARREAGLAGLEAYVSRLTGGFAGSGEFVGVGAGETAAEGLHRGLQACLREALGRQPLDRLPPVVRVRLGKVDDARCRYYLRSLTLMQGEPAIGLGEASAGFPVFWVGAGGSWYAGVGLNRTLALRSALQAALMKAQNPSDFRPLNAPASPSLPAAQEDGIRVDIAEFDETSRAEVVSEALQMLRRNGWQLTVVNLAVEPFMSEALEAVYGVSLLEEGTSKAAAGEAGSC